MQSFDETIEAFLAEGEDEPVVMLNLMCFRPDGGRERFAEYKKLAEPLLVRHGGEFLFEGPVGAPLAGGPALPWEHLVLVRYAHRRQFVALMRDPEYAAANELRVEAVSEAVIQPLRA